MNMSQLQSHVQRTLLLIKNCKKSPDECNSVLETSCNVLTTAVKDGVDVSLANDLINIIIEVDNLTKQMSCNIDMLVRVWSCYLPLLKKCYLVWSTVAIDACVDCLMTYVNDGVTSIVNEVSAMKTSQPLPQMPDILRSKIPLLNFFLQRLFATIVYRGKDLSPRKIYAALIQIASLRGVISVLNQPEIASAQEKFDTLLLRSMGVGDINCSLCEDVLWSAYQDVSLEVCHRPSDICEAYTLPVSFLQYAIRGLLYQLVEHLKCFSSNTALAASRVRKVTDLLLCLLSVATVYPRLFSDASYTHLIVYICENMSIIFLHLASTPQYRSCASDLLELLVTFSLSGSKTLHRVQNSVASVILCTFTSRLPMIVQRQVLSIFLVLAKRMLRTHATFDNLNALCGVVFYFSVMMPNHDHLLLESMKKVIDATDGRSSGAIMRAFYLCCGESGNQFELLREIKKYVMSSKGRREDHLITAWIFDGTESIIDIASAVQNADFIARYIEVLMKGNSKNQKRFVQLEGVSERLHHALRNMRLWTRGLFVHRISLNASHKTPLLSCLQILSDVCDGRRYGDTVALVALICACDMLICTVRIISSSDCEKLKSILENLHNAVSASATPTTCVEWSYLLTAMVSFRSEITSIDVKKQLRNVVPGQMVSAIQARSNHHVQPQANSQGYSEFQARIVQCVLHSSLPATYC